MTGEGIARRHYNRYRYSRRAMNSTSENVIKIWVTVVVSLIVLQHSISISGKMLFFFIYI